jgi:threonine/homoserine/homoserine lactone efflux protein
MSGKKPKIFNFLLGVFLILLGVGLIFTGIGLVGTFILWWIAYNLITN